MVAGGLRSVGWRILTAVSGCGRDREIFGRQDGRELDYAVLGKADTTTDEDPEAKDSSVVEIKITIRALCLFSPAPCLASVPDFLLALCHLSPSPPPPPSPSPPEVETQTSKSPKDFEK